MEDTCKAHEKMAEQIEQIAKTVEEIKAYLVGSEFYPGGLIAKMKDYDLKFQQLEKDYVRELMELEKKSNEKISRLQDDIYQLKKLKWKIIGWVGGAGAVTTAVGFIIGVLI